MDWEKQDNELRQLMEGSDFLPEEDNWKALAGWRKLQEKKQPAKKKLISYWIQLASAACVVGLIGFALWWMQPDNVIPGTEDVVQKEKIDRTKGEKGVVIEDRKTQQNATISINPERENIVNGLSTENVAQKKEMKQNSHSQIQEALVQNQKEGTVKQHDEIEIFAGIEQEKANESNNPNTVVPAPEASPNIPVAQSAVAIQKPKLRVVHYNELNGMHATAPPVFVLSKKSETEWENTNIQNTTTQKGHPYSLKIDISPAPKKSL